jgi:putative transposase
MGTYKQIFYQIIFSTKNRKLSLNEEHCQHLYKYIWGIINNRKCKLYRINGTANHIHIFSDLHPSICLADLVRDIKVNSSIWLKTCGLFPLFEAWQEGYSAFTYSIREKNAIINYIKNQKEHHAKEIYTDELIRLLKENDIEYNAQFLL